MTRRVVAAVAVLVLVAGAAAVFLATWGDDDPYAAYCSEVEEQQQPLTEAFASGQTTGLIRALPSFRVLAERAPDDISDDWTVVIDRVEELEAALQAAGVDPESYDRRDPPAGLEPGDKEAIDAAALALVAPDAHDAFANVEQQARDVCQTPLSL